MNRLPGLYTSPSTISSTLTRPVRMSFIVDTIIPGWVAWLMTVEATLVGIGFVAMWARIPRMSLTMLFGGWLAATMLVFAITLAVIYILVPVAVSLAVSLIVIVALVLIVSIFRRSPER